MQTVPWPKHFFLLFQFLAGTSLCFTDQETQEENVLGGPTPLWVSTYTSYLLYKVQDPFSACRESHGRNIFSSFSIFSEDQSLLHRPRNSGRECAWWTNSLVGQYLHQLSLLQSLRSIQRMQTVPWPKHFCLLQFLGGTSLCFTDQETQEENVLCGPTPLWVSTYTSYLLYKVPGPFSACRQSLGQNIFSSFSIFRVDQSLLHRPRNSGRECAWWTNSLVGQYLHQLSLVQSSRSIFRMLTVLWPKHFCLLQFLGSTSLCFTDQETQEENVLGGPTPLWVSTYTSYLLYKAQGPFLACRQSHGQNIFFSFNF